MIRPTAQTHAQLTVSYPIGSYLGDAACVWLGDGKRRPLWAYTTHRLREAHCSRSNPVSVGSHSGLIYTSNRITYLAGWIQPPITDSMSSDSTCVIATEASSC